MAGYYAVCFQVESGAAEEGGQFLVLGVELLGYLMNRLAGR